MAKEGKINKLVAIKSMFLSNNVTRMKDIADLSPTMVARGLRLNHSRYVQKLYKPEEFTVKQIVGLGKLLDLDPTIIWTVIIEQLKTKKK